MIFILTTKLENGYKSTCPLFPEWSLTYSGTDWNEFENTQTKNSLDLCKNKSKVVKR